MQALMLAAGKGSRLGKYTKNNTKCMLEVNGITLLRRAVNALKKANINKLIMVVGYQKENVKEYVKEHIKDIEIIFVDNDDYSTTNNIYSLYMAKDYLLEDDTILLESDLLYDESIISQLVNSEFENAAVVAKYDQWMDGTVTVVDDDKNIVAFIEKKDFDFLKLDSYYKTVNIYKFSKKFSEQLYLPFLEAYVKSYGKNDYYELVLKLIVGLKSANLKAFVLDGQPWYEIDDIQDYDIASVIFAKEENKLELYQKRFGGYWRFSDLLDYCYLVNPYFPTEIMKNKMKSFYDQLLTNYPSSMSIMNICASRMFDNIDDNHLMIGNGASELINSLKYVIEGKIGLCMPSFNEYVRCFPNNEIVEINTSIDNYTYNIKRLLEILLTVDCLTLINPDNPSGSFISYEDIIIILNEAKKLNKWVIIDESFIDFANSDVRYTLINDDILIKYPKLIVIKSISKSYGVPGLRLGVLATSNTDTLKIIKQNLPVWNINSFAEYFLQIITLYKKDYVIACNKIAEERKRFFTELSKIKYIKPFRSEANYIMCKLIDVDANKLAFELLDKYKIFIKVLNNKKGIENGQYIRLAVKSFDDDNFLIKALKEFK